jgi:hypothetical protein
MHRLPVYKLLNRLRDFGVRARKPREHLSAPQSPIDLIGAAVSVTALSPRYKLEFGFQSHTRRPFPFLALRALPRRRVY